MVTHLIATKTPDFAETRYYKQFVEVPLVTTRFSNVTRRDALDSSDDNQSPRRNGTVGSRSQSLSNRCGSAITGLFPASVEKQLRNSRLELK